MHRHGFVGKHAAENPRIPPGMFRPYIDHTRTERLGMMQPEQWDQCIVVEQDSAFAPVDAHRHRRPQDQIKGITQASRPAFNRAKRRVLPRMRADARGHLAGSEGKRGCFSSVPACDVALVMLRIHWGGLGGMAPRRDGAVLHGGIARLG